MAAEPTTRFAHLLQPIRDLSKVWNIEIADELEKYIDEVAQLLVTNPEDGCSQLNFAEAALLIQGSTAIYSRKVELLYQLTYQALELLAVERKDGPNGKRVKAVHSGLWDPIPDTEELLTIDHLIKEGRNILLDRGAPETRQVMQRRVPLFLMPRDQQDRRKKEFRISSCTVHHTGVYLLQESDSKLLDDLLAGDDSLQIGGHPDAPLVPAPPREVQDLDNRLQELMRELPEEPPAMDSMEVETPLPPRLEELGQGQVVKQTPEKKQIITAMKGGLGQPSDPWALLDEHEAVGQDVPLEVGRTSKRINAKKFLTTADGLPDIGSCEGLSDEAWWTGEATAAGMAPMLAARHPVEALFLAVAGQVKSGGRYETQKAGFSAAWLEFEDLFHAALSRRRHTRATTGPKPSEPLLDAESDDEFCHLPIPPLHETVTPRKRSAPADDMLTPLPPPEPTDWELKQEEQRKEVAQLENMIHEAQLKYESTVRSHLQTIQKDAAGHDDRKFPQLYANVRKWQDQLEPVLKEFESRPEFDIHKYGTKFLKKMSDLQKSEGEEADVPFSRLVYGHPRWEVCRRFLTCLLLTNQGNTDINFASEEERLNKFKVKLLRADHRMISLEGDETAAKVATPLAAEREPEAAAKRRRVRA